MQERLVRLIIDLIEHSFKTQQQSVTMSDVDVILDKVRYKFLNKPMV